MNRIIQNIQNRIYRIISGILYAIYVLELLWKKIEDDETKLKKKSIKGMLNLMKI